MKKKRFLREGIIETWKAKRNHGIVTLLAVAVGAWINTWPAMILAEIVNQLEVGKISELWREALYFLGTLLLIGLVDFCRAYSGTRFGQRLLLAIRRRMLEKLTKLPIRYFNERPVGESMSRFTSDLDAMSALFTSGIVGAAADLFKIIGILAALFVLSTTLGILSLCCIPFLYGLSLFFRKRIYEKQLNVQEKVADIHTSIQELYTGIGVIKSYGKEAYFSDRFVPVLERHRRAMNANSVYDAWFPCVMQIVRAIAIACAVSVSSGFNGLPVALGLSAGAISAVADLISRLFEPIEAIALELMTIQKAMAGIHRLTDFMDQEEEDRSFAFIEANDQNLDVAISVKDVSFGYNPEESTLREISMTIPTGAKAAMIGRSGSGKTTLLHLIAGLYRPDSGSILVNGFDPFNMLPEQRRRLIGVVPQTAQLFHGTILDNITLKDEQISLDQVEKSLKAVGLFEHISSLPDGLETWLDEGETMLSLGQTQLLSLARAIVTNPPLLLLDEPTSGMDALTEAQLLDAIHTLSSSHTVLTISHRLSSVIDADFLHIMDKGKIRESGSPEQLTQGEGWYTVYKRLEESGWQMV